MTKKNKDNTEKNHINKMIEKALQSKDLNYLNFKDKNIDEIIEEINIYHQELEYQNIELSRIREELEKSKSHYIELFHNAPIGYVVFKEDSIIKEVNTTFAKLLNYDIKSIIGSKITNYIHPNDQDKFYIITKKLLKEKSINSIELVFKGNTNCTTIAEFNLYPADPGSEDKQNNLIRMAVTDISIRKKMELDILKAKEKAEESDKLKSAFLANMSHEIRTPMNGILGFTELLKNTNLNKNQKSHYLSIIEKSGKRMLSIINDLFDISRIEAGQIEVYNEKVSVNEVMKSLYDFFVEDANNKNLDLQCSHLKDEKPFTIYADKEKLNATMSNLLKNAKKFTSDGNISFGYEVKNNKIVFFVRDTGTGIPKNKQSYIFDRFVQGNYSNSRDYDGAGLGLAISKAYVEIMNGEIWVESKENAGSTFYFSIPMLKENTNQHNVSNNYTQTDNDLNNHNLSVIIVDDDENSAKLLVNLLQQGNKLYLAKTGKEVIDICKKNIDINLILMDIKLPDIDGHLAIKKIREFYKDVVIIGQSVHTSSESKKKALEAGCNEYISKPINAIKLFEIINKYI